MKFDPVSPKSDNQQVYLDVIHNNQIIFALGFPGSGKSFLALSAALDWLYNRGKMNGKKILVLRPMVRANIGEEFIGTLPGELFEKIQPWFGGIIDNIYKLLRAQEVQSLIKEGRIEFGSLSLCRGRDFENCFVIIDEAQNLTYAAIKMALTRINSKSKMVIIGDVDQTDLKGTARNDLQEAIQRLEDIEGIANCHLYDPSDIQRSPLIRKILERLNGQEDNI